MTLEPNNVIPFSLKKSTGIRNISFHAKVNFKIVVRVKSCFRKADLLLGAALVAHW